jgi:hypothetical protein
MLLLLALSTTIVRPTLEFTSRRASLHRSAAADSLVHRVYFPDGANRRSGSVMLGDRSVRGRKGAAAAAQKLVDNGDAARFDESDRDSPIDRLQRLRGGNTNATRNGKTVFWFLWLLLTAVVLARVAIKLCTHEPIEDDFFHHIFHQCVPELVVFMFVYDFVFPAIKYLYRVSVSR